MRWIWRLIPGETVLYLYIFFLVLFLSICVLLLCLPPLIFTLASFRPAHVSILASSLGPDGATKLDLECHSNPGWLDRSSDIIFSIGNLESSRHIRPPQTFQSVDERDYKFHWSRDSKFVAVWGRNSLLRVLHVSGEDMIDGKSLGSSPRSIYYPRKGVGYGGIVSGPWTPDEMREFSRQLFVYLAARGGYIPEMMSLLKNGSKVMDVVLNAPPIFVAARNGRLNMVRLLIQRGADPNQGCQSTGAMVPLSGPPLNVAGGSTALHAAAEKGHTEIADYLIQQEADIDRREGLAFQTPLQYAVREEKMDTIQFLLEKGATTNQAGFKSWSPRFES